MKTIIYLVIFSIFFNSQGQKKREIEKIPLTINEHNTVFVKAIFNHKDSLNLNFDTGTTELIFTNKTIKNKLKEPVMLYEKVYDLQIGNGIYQSKLYDAELAGHGTDGRFGWDLFKGKVVEINYDKNLLIIYSGLPKKVKKDKKYTELKLEFWKNLLFVKSTISQGDSSQTELFLFDSGYQKTVMLDNDLLKNSQFPTQNMEEINRVVMRGAKGNEIPVITSKLEKLTIGNYELPNVPAQLLTTNKPLRGKNTHILGNEVLKKFNIVFDFQNNFVYLKPNHFFDDAYQITKKKSN
jgi:hypothetical protein